MLQAPLEVYDSSPSGWWRMLKFECVDSTQYSETVFWVAVPHRELPSGHFTDTFGTAMRDTIADDCLEAR